MISLKTWKAVLGIQGLAAWKPRLSSVSRYSSSRQHTNARLHRVGVALHLGDIDEGGGSGQLLKEVCRSGSHVTYPADFMAASMRRKPVRYG